MTLEEAHRAIKRGDAAVLRNALDTELDPNLSNEYGWTLLMLAAISGNTEIGRLFVEHGARVDARNNFRDTALSLAIHTVHPSFVKLLLDAGASLDCHPHGNTFEAFLGWVEQYGCASAEQMKHIRAFVDEARNSRAPST